MSRTSTTYAAGHAALLLRLFRLPRATILFRLTFFFITGVISAGILVPYDSPLLTEAIATGVGADASPFVVGQKILLIKYLPDVFNAFIITAALSSANGYSQW